MLLPPRTRACISMLRKNNGVFILRIEDTDRARLVPGAAEELERMLRWAELEVDESPSRGGPYGPYVQSHRLSLYKKHIVSLIDSGHAYPCFCTPQRLLALRGLAVKSGTQTAYDGACRELSLAKREELLASGVSVCVSEYVREINNVREKELQRGRGRREREREREREKRKKRICSFCSFGLL